MSTHSMLSRLHKTIIYIIFSLLGSLLISLQLVLPVSSFAASPHTPSGYTFGNSQSMDLASVAVVRLVVSTTTQGANPRVSLCSTGLGVIVSSNKTQSNAYLNQVLTDGSLLTSCLAPTKAITITIYANDAYTNNRAESPLVTLFCTITLFTCGTPNAVQFSGKLATCQSSSCSKGAGLLSFATTVAQPYMVMQSSATSSSSSSFPIALENLAGATPPLPLSVTNLTLADLIQYLIPVKPVQQTNSSATPSVSPTNSISTPSVSPTNSISTSLASEPGTPLVDTNGLLAGIYTSTGGGTNTSETLITPLLTQAPFTITPLNNQLQTDWKTAITDFYKQSYSTVINKDLKPFTTLNPDFQAASALKDVATIRKQQATDKTKGKTTVPQNSTPWYENLILLLAIAGLILLILLLALITLIVGRRRRELARFEKEQESAGRTATLNAERIRMEEAARRISGPMAAQGGQQGQPVQVGQAGSPAQPGQPPYVAPAPGLGMSPGSQPVPVELHCPNCNYPYRGETYCPNCHVLLSPSDSGHHVYMVPPQSSPPPQPYPPVPNIQSPTLVPSSSIGDMPTLEYSPSQQSLSEETTAPVPKKAHSFNGHNVNIVAGSRSDPGIKRKQKPNEDSLLAVMGERTHNSLPQQFGLFVVADGMGGHANGQDASRLAIQTMVDRILPKLSSSEELNDQALVQLLVNGVQQANIAVYERNMEHHADMGTTMTSAIVVGGMAYVANVGDSRTYMYREPEGLHKITHDHSVVASLVEAGIIRNEDIYTHPKRNQIYRSLGEKPDLEVDSFVEPLQPGDKLLLCSDGLWEMVRDNDAQREQDIQRILSVPNADPKQTANALIKAANNGGGEDNITAIVVSVTEATTRTGMTGIHVFDMPESVKLPQM